MFLNNTVTNTKAHEHIRNYSSTFRAEIGARIRIGLFTAHICCRSSLGFEAKWNEALIPQLIHAIFRILGKHWRTIYFPQTYKSMIDLKDKSIILICPSDSGTFWQLAESIDKPSSFRACFHFRVRHWCSLSFIRSSSEFYIFPIKLNHTKFEQKCK